MNQENMDACSIEISLNEKEAQALSTEELKAHLSTCGLFIRDTLQPRLKELMDTKQGLEKEMDEYKRLKDLLAFLIIEKPSEYTSLVDVGSKCFMRAVVDQPATVYVHVGVGLHVELPLEDAVRVADERIALIRRRWAMVHDKAQECAAQLDKVFETMQKLKLVMRV